MAEYRKIRKNKSENNINNTSATSNSQNTYASIPNSTLNDVMAGKTRASSEMMGRRSNLAPSIAAKMSQAFGMDVSGVKLYKSDVMKESDMEGLASGDKVVLSSDVNLNTLEGQSVLGHEFSHIRSQNMGIGSGHGLLNDGGLEQQADTEGALAARGMSISGESLGMSKGMGMAGLGEYAAISGGMGASTAAPMQAKKKKKKSKEALLAEAKEREELEKKAKAEMVDDFTDDEIDEESDIIRDTVPDDQKSAMKFIDDLAWNKRNYSKQDVAWDNKKDPLEKAFQKNVLNKLGDRVKDINAMFPNNELNKDLTLSTGQIFGWNVARLTQSSGLEMADEYSNEELFEMYSNMAGLNGKDDPTILKGVGAYKKMMYKQLKKMEMEIGTTMSQMHPEDVIKKIGVRKLESYNMFMQDAEQLFQNSNGEDTNKLISEGTDGAKIDADMKRLLSYYSPMIRSIVGFGESQKMKDPVFLLAANNLMDIAKASEKDINGPRMNEKQMKEYIADKNERQKNGELMQDLEKITKKK